MARPAATVTDDPTVEARTPDKEMGPVFKAAAGPMKWADERLGLAAHGVSAPGKN